MAEVAKQDAAAGKKKSGKGKKSGKKGSKKGTISLNIKLFGCFQFRVGVSCDRRIPFGSKSISS